MLSHAPMLDNSLRYKEVTLVQCNHTIHLSLLGADMYYYSCMHVMYAVLVSLPAAMSSVTAPLVISCLEP